MSLSLVNEREMTLIHDYDLCVFQLCMHGHAKPKDLLHKVVGTAIYM